MQARPQRHVSCDGLGPHGGERQVRLRGEQGVRLTDRCVVSCRAVGMGAGRD